MSSLYQQVVEARLKKQEEEEKERDEEERLFNEFIEEKYPYIKKQIYDCIKNDLLAESLEYKITDNCSYNSIHYNICDSMYSYVEKLRDDPDFAGFKFKTSIYDDNIIYINF